MALGPGVRRDDGRRTFARDDGQTGDQKRVVTPRKAIDAGASILVVGRRITQAEDPDAAARANGATL